MKFPAHFSYETMIYSQTATRKGIDNTPSEAHTRNLLRVAWFLASLRTRLIDHYSDINYGTILVTSGYRCQRLNTKIGGSKNSSHMKGFSADIVVPELTAFELAKFIEAQMVEHGWDQLIHEFGQWVHVGLSDRPQRDETLTAKKLIKLGRRKTVYVRGIEKVAA